MPKRCELIEGEKRNRLTYVKEAEPYISPKGGKFRQIFVTCECSPDKEFVVRLDSFLNGHLKSCGCYNIEKIKERMTTHGKSKTRIYSIYKGLKRRCYCPNRPNYKDYGGRGITICDEWLDDFATFYEWSISHGYADNLTIDRVDNNRNYEPDNCQWISRSENIAKRNKDIALKTNNSYLAISPDGNEFIFTRVTIFAEEKGLNRNAIYKVIRGIQHQTKGWKFKKLENKIQEAI